MLLGDGVGVGSVGVGVCFGEGGRRRRRRRRRMIVQPCKLKTRTPLKMWRIKPTQSTSTEDKHKEPA